MTYLFDTNICIYLINHRYDELIERVEGAGIEEIAISTITIAELEFGIANSNSCYKEENRTALIEFLLPFKFLSFEQNDAYEYGLIRSELKSQGNMIGNMDMLIGAQALSRDLILITNNVKEFERIEGLRIENWVFGT